MSAGESAVAAGLGWIYAVSGRRADALKIAKEFKDLSLHAYVDSYKVAMIYAGLGDKERRYGGSKRVTSSIRAPCPISQQTRSGTGCVPIPATPTCCAEWRCRNPSDLPLVKRYILPERIQQA